MKLISIFEKLNRFLFPKLKISLGRWNIHNHKETALKILYANEDNCYNNNHKNIIDKYIIKILIK